jgi:hypothetical protein
MQATEVRYVFNIQVIISTHCCVSLTGKYALYCGLTVEEVCKNKYYS